MKLKQLRGALNNNIWRNLIFILTFSFLISVTLVIGFLKILTWL